MATRSPGSALDNSECGYEIDFGFASYTVAKKNEGYQRIGVGRW